MPAELPHMNEMLKEYLERRTSAHSAGMAAVDRGEVEPYDAVPPQVLDPKQAWDEATTVFAHFGLWPNLSAPADWPSLVANPDTAIALPFAAGYFPQSVRDLQRLARSVPPAELPTETGAPIPADGLDTWVGERESSGDVAGLLLTAGVLRLARQFDRAERVLKKCEKEARAQWKSAWTNERAALLWVRGPRVEAEKLWKSLPQSAPALFNRGVAALFLGDKSAARESFCKAVTQIAESSGWHHLGRLYLALAQS